MPPRLKMPGESSRKGKEKVGMPSKPKMSKEAKEKLNRIKDKKAIPERYIDLNSNQRPEYKRINDEIQRRQWQDFASMPVEGNLTLVKEFYASFADFEREQFDIWQKETKVRGVSVSFRPDTINSFYGVPALARHDGDDVGRFLNNREAYDEEDVVKVIGTEGTTWEHMTGKDLNNEAKFWLHFVDSRLMPGKNATDLTRERILMVYCIMTKREVDIGYTIHLGINQSGKRNPKSLWFPNLISSLCAMHNVPSKDNDERIPPGKPLHHGSYFRLRQRREQGGEEDKAKKKKKGKEASSSSALRSSPMTLEKLAKRLEKESKHQKRREEWENRTLFKFEQNLKEMYVALGMQGENFRESSPPPEYEVISSNEELSDKGDEENEEE